MKKAFAVVGSNWGDESKGLVTDWLCAQTDADIVVRYCSGANAGHTVVTPHGKRHVFHHFGAGSFLDIPTYLSQFFVCNPILFMQELRELENMGMCPKVYVHPDAVITTVIDMLINQYLEDGRGNKRHGSCGVGIHETMIRSLSWTYKLTMRDLCEGNIRSTVEAIADRWSISRIGKNITPGSMIDRFIRDCNEFLSYVHVGDGLAHFKTPVFEGAQGLLLDQDNREYFPHVTHSKTGMHNVNILCAEAGFEDPEVYYVSRTYLTRHGAGYLPGEDPKLKFMDKTNVSHDYQGSLRFAKLDPDALLARCEADRGSKDFKLVMTHCDQWPTPCVADVYTHGETRSDVVFNNFRKN